MARKRYNLNLPEDLYDRAKVAAGDVPMSRFVERALEAALSGARKDVAPHDVAGAPADGPVSPRASEPPIRSPEGIAELEAVWDSPEVEEQLSSRSCSRCGVPIKSPSLTRHPSCGGKIVPEPV